MPIKSIEELEKRLEGLYKTESIDLLGKKYNIGVNPNVQKSVWKVKIRDPIVEVLKNSKTDLLDHFLENENDYKERWLSKIQKELNLFKGTIEKDDRVR